MKKYLFLFVAMVFGGLLFWNLTYFDFNSFHFYGFLDEVFSVINSFTPEYFLQYLPSLLLLGVFLVSLVFAGLFFENVYVPFFILMLLQVLLYFLMPQISFIFIGLAFAAGSLMFLGSVFQHQEKKISFSFFEITHQAITQFMRYALIILCLYNFVLIKNQPFTLPTSVLNTVMNSLENSLLREDLAGNITEKLDLNEAICNKEGVDKNLCLEQLSQLLSVEELNNLAEELGHIAPEELNLSEIVNFKIRAFLEPYQVYLPYFITMIFFSSLYFLATFLIFVYALMAEIIYIALLKVGFIRIDIKEVAQEYLV